MPASMYGDLLVRVAAIQGAITGVTGAVPRLFDPFSLNADPAGRFFNGIQRIQPDYEVGTGWHAETVRVLMRFVAGALGTNYDAHEDTLHAMYARVVETFAERGDLEHPQTGEAFRYLESPARIVEVIGGRGMQTTPGGVEVLAADFILEARLYYPVSRVG